MRRLTAIFAALILMLTASAASAIDLCGRGKRYNCVVDGDTIWLEGKKYRMAGYDTPETQTHICGGAHEVALGRAASARLIDLINGADLVEIEDLQRRGSYGRGLIDLYVDGRNVGDVLISEGLAQRWPDGPEFWCR